MKRREFITLIGSAGRMAACGARAAGGEAADHRVSGRGHGFGLEAMGGRICTAAARIGLDRRPHDRDRIILADVPDADVPPLLRQ
jgi:hypothetical protein